MTPLEVTRGASIDRVIQVANLDGTYPTTGDFLSTDTIAATVSIGDGYPSLFAPDVSWTAGDADVTTGKFSLAIDDADTASLEAGEYLIAVTNARSGRTATIAKIRLIILGAIGTATAPTVYCTYQDLEDELPWIGELKDASSDLTGFLKQRGDARKWMDGLILSSLPRGGYGLDSSRSDRWTWDFGGGGGTWGGNSLAEDATIKGYLDDDNLMLDCPAGQKVIDACVYWTLAKILRRTGVSKPGVSMAGLASEYMRMANGEATRIVAQIDTNDDDVAEITIPLGVANVRRA